MTSQYLDVMIADDERVARRRLRRMLSDIPELRVIAEAEDGEETVSMILKHNPDIVFLDIQMPGKNGFEVLSSVSEMQNIPAIIFVTAFDNFAIQAFEVAAVDYVMKPFSKERIKKAVTRAETVISQGKTADVTKRFVAIMEKLVSQDRTFSFKENGRIVVLRLSEIGWIEAKEHSSCIRKGKESHICRMSLSEILEQLPSPPFQRVHKSYIVNLDHVKQMDPLFHGDYVLIMKDQSRVMMSRSYSHKIKRLLGYSS
ncbi:LytTR family DNA-binding domain-containing protein [bacterium]|nr:LytTR family DNA-binding domain-containing protein [bacterium]